jgi:hypothetical protein
VFRILTLGQQFFMAVVAAARKDLQRVQRELVDPA